MHTHTENIWKNIHKILRIVSPSSRIMREFTFCSFLCLSSYFYLLIFQQWTWITHIIKNVKNRLHFDCKTSSLLFVPTKISFRTYNKNKTKVPLTSEFRKYSILLHQIWINTKGSLWKGTNAWDLDLLPSLPPLLLCHQISKTYISFSLLWYVKSASSL